MQVLVQAVQKPEFGGFARPSSLQKERFADLVFGIAKMLSASPFVEEVEAFKDENYQSWTIEVTVHEPSAFEEYVLLLAKNKEHVLSLAKNELFEATRESANIYIMGYAANPFMTKPHGFVTVLGDMQGDGHACWDLYARNNCSRGRACQLIHPEFLVPINVVVKERSVSRRHDMGEVLRGGRWCAGEMTWMRSSSKISGDEVPCDSR